MSTPRRPRRRVVASALVALAAVAGMTACEPPPPDTYVALGDSYVAGPLIPDQSLSPLGCLRSSKNYPRLAAPKIKVTKFVDVSCSGAQTKHMFETQGVTPGPHQAQLLSLSNQTKVVTLGIGGNDIGFSSIVQDCALENPFGSGCKADFVSGGVDRLSQNIANTAPKVANVLASIKTRAPRAKVFVVGYPAILPDTGSGCYPTVPILPTDVPYLRDKTKELNAMLRTQALAAGAVFVDLYTPSVNRNACTSAGTRWVEGLIPGSAAAPVHPNGAGMRAFADIVAARINQVVTA